MRPCLGDLKALPELRQQTPPWWRPFDPECRRAVDSLAFDALLEWLNHLSASSGLQTGRGQPLRFMPQDRLPEHATYEGWIAQTGEVPTRDNLHDRYNALIWMSFPKTKAKLNAVQASELDRLGPAGARGPVRDAATLWDENLVVIVAHQAADALQAALDTHDWPYLFWASRKRWHHDWQVVPFGHALLEKLATPYKAITGHVIVEPMESLDLALLDQQLSGRVHLQMSTAAFRPLPVMGLPEWDPTNQNPDFYADPKVFRPTNPS